MVLMAVVESPPMAMVSAVVPPVPMLMVSAPVPVPMLMVLINAPPAPRFKVVAAVEPMATVVAVVSPKAKLPAAMVSRPWPAVRVMVPPDASRKFWEVSVRVLPVPTLQVEAAAPVKFNAPAALRAKVPEVVVERVKFPEVESILLVPAPEREMPAPVPELERASTAPVAFA